MTKLDESRPEPPEAPPTPTAEARLGMREEIGQILRGNVRQYGMILALVLIALLFQTLTYQYNGGILTPINITNMILQNSYILVLAIGMMLVIINGHIDLSVGSVCALIGAIAGVMIVHWGLPWPVAVVAALLVGAAIGAWQGFWIAYMRIPAFIVTLAGMLLFRGLAQRVLDGETISGFPDGFRQIAAGYLPGAGDGVHVLTLVLGLAASAVVVWLQLRGRRMRASYGLRLGSRPLFWLKVVGLIAVINAFSVTLAVHKGIPIVGLVVIALVLLYSIVMQKSVIGRQTYAVGGNEKAALLSGVKTKKNTLVVFINMGVLAALAGVIFAARLTSATPKAGVNFELDAIAAAFVGGASASGGIGTVVGAIVGALVMGVMNMGMSILGLSPDWQQAIKGLVLLLAVAFDVYNKRKARS
ncbi:MAG TPA: multiple monosaccharide ABC transporter permease [Stackebrandtia sp.]|nr:multiple monosaccharide ABC transporter permease [Stackebrandtia sp.]HZE41343.1 multiple monosaccharide ABC transporter permease [Stackebrandtia sp.]